MGKCKGEQNTLCFLVVPAVNEHCQVRDGGVGEDVTPGPGEPCQQGPQKRGVCLERKPFPFLRKRCRTKGQLGQASHGTLQVVQSK